MQEMTKTAPEEFDSVCPITFQTFRDPVKAPDGHTYERQAIVQWITEHGTSPFSRQPLNVKDLVPDDHVRDRADRRANSTASFDTYEEPAFYRSSRVTPINDKILTAKGENGHVPRKGRCCRQRRYIAILILLAIVLSATGLTVGILLRKSREHIISKYSSKLTESSPTYCRTTCEQGNFFYEAITVPVVTSGTYHITSKSHVDTYGYIYNNSFSWLDPRKNLLAENNDGCGKKQFKLKVDLQSGRTYVLVATTNLPGVTGDFSIVVSGPTSVRFSPTTTTETTTTSGIPSSYSLELSTNSSMYCGPKESCKKPKFYYQTIRVNVSMNGSYRFMSSKPSKKNVDIYVYNNSFNSLYPTTNLISKSDDSSEEKPPPSLLAGNTYILVVTTDKLKKKETFVITAKGAGLVTFSESQ